MTDAGLGSQDRLSLGGNGESKDLSMKARPLELLSRAERVSESDCRLYECGIEKFLRAPGVSEMPESQEAKARIDRWAKRGRLL